MNLANFEEALADATKCTELKPEFVKGWARLGAAKAALERLDEAEEAFQHGLSLESENKLCLDGLKDVEKKREGPKEEEKEDEEEEEEDEMDVLEKEDEEEEEEDEMD